MNTRLVAFGIIALFLALLIGSLFLFPAYIVSGYGGLSTKVHSVETPYPGEEVITFSQGDTVAVVDYTGANGVFSTALRLEVGQPMYTGDNFLYHKTITKTDVYEDGDTLNRTWEVHIAYFDLSFTVETQKPGDWPKTDITFWIELQENQFSVFEAPDEVEAYILSVVTTETVQSNDITLVDVIPEAKGFSFDMLALDSKPIPKWMSDAGYQGLLSELKHVRFSIHVNSMNPFIFGLERIDNHATWKCEISALVFGYWEVYSPYYEWGFPFFNLFGFLDDIFAGLSIIIGLAVGIVLSIAIIRFIPNRVLAGIILIVAWAIIILSFGFLELLA